MVEEDPGASNPFFNLASLSSRLSRSWVLSEMGGSFVGVALKRMGEEDHAREWLGALKERERSRLQL